MQKYTITQEYYDEYPELAEAGYSVGDEAIISPEGHLVKLDGDPILPPPQRPPIIPG